MSDSSFVIKNSLVVNNNLIVAANGKVGFLTTTPDATLTVNGTANVTGNVTLNGSNLSVNSNTLIIAPSITLQTNSTTQSLVISGNSSASNLSINATNVNVNANFSLSGTQNVSGNVNLGNGILFVDANSNKIGINTVTPDANLAIIGTANVSGNVTINGANTIINSNTAITGPNISLNSNSTFNAFNITANSTVVNTTINGTNVAVNGNTIFTGSNVAINANVDVSGSNVNISGNTTITGSNIYFVSPLRTAVAITTNATTNAVNTTIQGDVFRILSNTMLVTNARLSITTTAQTNIIGNTYIQSNSTITAISVGANSTATNTTINGDNLNINANTNLSGSRTNVTGTAVFTANVVMNGNTYVGSNTLFVAAGSQQVGINTTNPDAALAVNGSANVIGTLRVGGDLIVTGNLTYSGTSSADIIPTSNSFNLGNTTNRWSIYGMTATFANTMTVLANTYVGANDLIVDTVNHRVGINGVTPSNTLTVNGQIYSTTGGFRFPDNTVQTTAALTIGGSNTQVQFNDSGVFGGSAGFVFNKASNTLTVSNTFSSQIVSLANGTSSAPSLTWNGWGFYSSGSNTVSYTSSNLIRWSFNNGTLISAQAPVQISTMSPSLQVFGADNNTSAIGIVNYANDITQANTSVLVFGKSNSNTKGTVGTSNLADNTSLGMIRWTGANASSVFANMAFIDSRQAGTGAKLGFWTASVANTEPVQRMVISNTGLIGIGTDSPNNNLTVIGNTFLGGNVTTSGCIFGYNGDASAPAFSFALNAATGMYQIGPFIGFSSGGVSKAIINSTALYIGPTVNGVVNGALTVDSTINVGGLATMTAGATISGGQISISNNIVQSAGNTNLGNGRLFVDATNGRVGINNVTPTVALTVTGDALISGNTTISGSAVISGNLTINGTTTFVNTATLNVADNIVTLNSDVTGAPSENAGVEINRGTSANVSLLWNETSDRWTLTNDGAAFANILYSGYSGATLTGNTSIDSPTFFVDATNHRVGIGNTAPNAKLQVTGTANIDGTTTINGDIIFNSNQALITANTFGVLSNSTFAAMVMVANPTTPPTMYANAENYTITSNAVLFNTNTGFQFAGNQMIVTANLTFSAASARFSGATNTFSVNTTSNMVGVGTFAPDATLAVVGTANVSANVRLGQTLTVIGNVAFNSTGLHTIAGNVNFDTNTLFVDSVNNRVGVGSAAPDVTFSVTGDSKVWGNFGVSQTAIMNGNTTIAGTFANITSNATIGGTTATITSNLVVSGVVTTIAGNTSFATNKVFVDGTNGRLAVNTNAPGVSLVIAANDAILVPIGTTAQRPTGANGMIRYNANTNGFEGFANGGWGVIGGVVLTGSNTQVQFNDSGALGGNANLTFDKTTGVLTAASFNTLSDYRVKNNVISLSNSLERLEKINVYSYNMNDEEIVREGVLAHELQEVLPFAVDGIKDGSKYQSVDYSKIVPLLIGAIKELKEEIEKLKSNS